MADDTTSGQWIGRPWVARGIRLTVCLVPFAASVAFAWQLSRLFPMVSTIPAAIARWLLIAAASTFVMIGFDRITRRLLPLAALYSLTLAFPDRAPSRFRIALRTGTTAQLRAIVAEAREGKVGDTPADAAEKLLELVSALSAHDRLTRGHSERVRAYTQMVGEEMGLSGTELDRLRWAGLLHDVGKLLISPEILNKPGKLTDEEFDAIRQHPEFGRGLVAPLAEWLGDAARAVWEHHERWDGRGYPLGIVATDISLAGRIVSVVDAFDVMTSARSYKEPMSARAARAELARCAGSQFDPAVVRAFLNVSIGRLLVAMGPLSWLTQLSFVPQAFVTAGATGATTLTAAAGLGAGALGVGLSGDGMFTATTVQASETTVADDGPAVAGSEPDPRSVDRPAAPGATPPTTPAAPGPGVPTSATTATSTTTTNPDAPAPGTVPTGPGLDTPTTVADGQPRPTAPTPGTSPRTGGPATTRPGGSATTAAPVPTTPITPSTQPGVPATTRPTTTAAPQAPTTVAAPTTTAAPTANTTSTTTTVVPTPLGTTTLYLVSPGSGAVASQSVLPLATAAPTDLLVANYDTDRNGDPGLTLARGAQGAAGEQHFRWDATSHVRLAGTMRVTLFVSGPGLLSTSNLVVDVDLRRCDGANCTAIASGQGTSPGPLLGLPLVWGEMPVQLGAVDIVLEPGDSLELRVAAPSASSRDVWLGYDATLALSRLQFTSN